MTNYPIETIRHSTAHVLAAAVLELFPGTKLGVGPVIENGFFYDVDLPRAISSQDLLKIEKRMHAIVARNEAFRREEMPIDAAIEYFKKLEQPMKVALLVDLKTKGTTSVRPEEAQDVDPSRSAVVSVYHTGKFVDLCRGPHVATTKDLAVFKLTKIAGAYWRGSEKNKQLTRIYGLAFSSASELADYLRILEEAEKRDHRKLGAELGLFAIIDEVGPGLPLFYPRGALLRRLVEGFLSRLQESKGYQEIWIPHITKAKLYEISGHLQKYDALYPPMELPDEAMYYLKPMNCPHFMMLYKEQPKSYRDLPLRWTATTTVYRYEKSGELAGLLRVRGLTQDDCHVFAAPDQIEHEIDLMLDMVKATYRAFKFDDFHVRISLHDPKNREKYIGDPPVWERSEATLKRLVGRRKWKHEVAIGEAAFYGPKLDFIVRDAIGREWQLSTIQLDMNLTERFGLEYVNAENGKSRPVVIHRAILGSTERFLGILIEHFAGAFPVWLAPVQAAIIPVGKDHIRAAEKLERLLTSAGVRALANVSRDTVGYKIRLAEKQKIPYMLVVGDKEKSLKKLSVRIRGVQKLKAMTVKSLAARVVKESAIAP